MWYIVTCTGLNMSTGLQEDGSSYIVTCTGLNMSTGLQEDGSSVISRQSAHECDKVVILKR